MKFRQIAALAVCLLCASLTVQSQGLYDEEAVFSEAASGDQYNIELSLTPGADVARDSGVQIALEWETPGTAALLTMTRTRITLVKLLNSKTGDRHQATIDIFTERQTPVTIMRRGPWLGILLDETLVLSADMPRTPGARASLKTGVGWQVNEPNIQPLEPVFFTDDFMRVENDQWGSESGEWLLANAWEHDIKSQVMRMVDPGAAQNPFALVGRGTGDAPAWSLSNSGESFWEDYSYSAAIQPPEDGAVGLLVNMVDDTRGLLVRWSPASERGAEGNSVALYTFAAGERTLLARADGGSIPGQWFKLSVTSSLRDGVQVAVDGEVRLSFANPPYRRGGIGLYSESRDGAIFDDIAVLGTGLDADLLADTRLRRVNQRFQNDEEMQAWSKTQNEWQSWPDAPSTWKHRFDYYGDQWIMATLTPVRIATAQIMLTLCGNGKELTSGYRAHIQRTREGVLSYALYRNDVKLADIPTGEPLTNNEAYDLVFRRDGARLSLLLDGETILTATDPEPLTGLRPAYRAEGGFNNLRDVLVTGRQVLDYTFANAPVDWYGDGHWQSTIRWSCAPQWSFLGGWSRGDAVLWHKQRFTGDQTFQAYASIKMEYPRQQQIYEDRFRALGITICGDGVNPRSGYAVLFGAPDAQDNPNKRTVLLRNGVEVASIPQVMPEKTYGHHTWFDMVLEKRGDTVTFTGKYLSKNMWWRWDQGKEITVTLSYTDPQPLAGGVPAVWSENNGITIARSRIFFAEPPQFRREPLVSINQPWYPEWANVGTPMTLTFSPSWSTSGNPARLHVAPAQVPAGEELQAKFEANQLTFSPRQRADYWYTIYADEGQQRSTSAHLSLPAFDPKLGRDDSHALLLYRFDEGEGTRVRDHSAIAPAADLLIPDGATTQWLPGRGLLYLGPEPLRTSENATRLKALAENKAFTFEFWLSPDTNDPPTGSNGTLLSWGDVGGNTRNVTFQHNWYNLVLTGNTTYYDYRAQQMVGPHWQSNYLEMPFHMGLRHVAISWDGASGFIYIDGRLRTSVGDLSKIFEGLNPEMPLLIGNTSALNANFMGNLYLVAVHDRCLSATEVQRHFNAGPDAQ